MLTYGSLFAGVGGFDQGFDAAGAECRWQVEWDKNCQKLLKQKWPKAKHYGDITTVRAGELERVDVVCGGSPCQDLSVAGKRAGMAGGRSGLFHDMVRICKHQRSRGGARYIEWENVDGAFSSNGGRDFAAVLRAFTGLAVEVPVDGWGRAGFIKTPFPAWRWNCAWRVFDAQYFGVPQRRRRVFLVASAGDGSCAEILFEPESLRGDSPPSRGAGQDIAGTVSSRTSGGGGLGTDFDLAGGLQASGGGADENDAKDGRLIITHSLRGEGFDASEDVTGRGTPIVPIAFSSKDHGADAASDVSPTLRAMSHHKSHLNGGGQIAIAFHPTQDPISSTDGSTHAMGCGSKQGQASIAIAIQEIGKRTGTSTSDVRCGLGIADDGDPMFTLQSGAQHGVAVAFDTTQITSPENRCNPQPGDPYHPLSSSAHAPAIAFSGRNRGAEPAVGRPEREPLTMVEKVGSLETVKPWNVAIKMAVRRLVPVECERLMGWPDNHTAGFSDSVRYKMCGNGIVASCSTWIAHRIVNHRTTKNV